jgi:hypothetical protein
VRHELKVLLTNWGEEDDTDEVASGPENETVAATTQAYDEDVSNPRKTELNEQSSNETLQESQKTKITLSPLLKKSQAKTPSTKRHKKG